MRTTCYILLFCAATASGQWTNFPLTGNTNYVVWQEIPFEECVSQVVYAVNERLEVLGSNQLEIVKTNSLGPITNSVEYVTTNVFGLFTDGTYTGRVDIWHSDLTDIEGAIDTLFASRVWVCTNEAVVGAGQPNFDTWFSQTNAQGYHLASYPIESKAGACERLGIGFRTNLVYHEYHTNFVADGDAWLTERPALSNWWVLAELHGVHDGIVASNFTTSALNGTYRYDALLSETWTPKAYTNSATGYMILSGESVGLDYWAIVNPAVAEQVTNADAAVSASWYDYATGDPVDGVTVAATNALTWSQLRVSDFSTGYLRDANPVLVYTTNGVIAQPEYSIEIRGLRLENTNTALSSATAVTNYTHTQSVGAWTNTLTNIVNRFYPTSNQWYAVSNLFPNVPPANLHDHIQLVYTNDVDLFAIDYEYGQSYPVAYAVILDEMQQLLDVLRWVRYPSGGTSNTWDWLAGLSGDTNNYYDAAYTNEYYDRDYSNNRTAWNVDWGNDRARWSCPATNWNTTDPTVVDYSVEAPGQKPYFSIDTDELVDWRWLYYYESPLLDDASEEGDDDFIISGTYWMTGHLFRTHWWTQDIAAVKSLAQTFNYEHDLTNRIHFYTFESDQSSFPGSETIQWGGTTRIFTWEYISEDGPATWDLQATSDDRAGPTNYSGDYLAVDTPGPYTFEGECTNEIDETSSLGSIQVVEGTNWGYGNMNGYYYYDDVDGCYKRGGILGWESILCGADPDWTVTYDHDDGNTSVYDSTNGLGGKYYYDEANSTASNSAGSFRLESEQTTRTDQYTADGSQQSDTTTNQTLYLYVLDVLVEWDRPGGLRFVTE